MSKTVQVVLLAAALLASPPSTPASDEQGDAGANAETDGEALRWDERVEVRAVVSETASAPLGASSTVIDPTETANAPSSLTDLVTEVPGVSENGQGGLLQVFSIRGVSRQRVMSLISGMRITSERRAGVSTSFVDPGLMGTVEVLRGPATTFYGSGALGGVVQVLPREFSGWNFSGGYDSNGDEHHQLFGAGGDGWSVGVAQRHAADGEVADGTRVNSEFTQLSSVFRLERERGKLRYELLAIPTYAEDIGKANIDPGRTTNYPRERHQLVRFSVASERGWRVHSFVHAHDIETEVVGGAEQSNVFNDTVDLGLRWEDERQFRRGASLRYGVDGFGRRDVDAEEIQQNTESGDRVTMRTIDGAEETELGGFGSARWNRGPMKWEVGGRFSWIGQENAGDAEVDRTALNGFAGASRTFGDRFELRASVSSGLRFPSLTEQFFSGTTGRGEVVGNPALDDERSLNTEITTRWIGRNAVLSGVVFHNEIDDYIERDEIADNLWTFLNLSSGTLQGIELQAVVHPAEAWSLSGGGHVIEGEDEAGVELADTPPNELYLGAARQFGGWRTEAKLILRDRRDETGSGEQPIPSAELLSASARHRWPNGWEIGIGATNLLDEKYFASADRRAPLAFGRAFAVQVTRRGRWRSP